MTFLDHNAAERPTPRMILGGVFVLLLLALITARPTGAAERCKGGDTPLLAQSAPGRIAFGDRMRTVTLASTCGPISAAVRRAGPGARFFLVVEDLRATTQPGAIFDLSLAPSEPRFGKARGGHTRMLGTLNFFNAHPASAGAGRRVSYDVSDALKTLAARDRLSSGIVIEIAPLSAPERASDASAGAIRLVLQSR
jgi:hypothetical protein